MAPTYAHEEQGGIQGGIQELHNDDVQKEMPAPERPVVHELYSDNAATRGNETARHELSDQPS